MRHDCNDVLTELESWYALDNGQYLLDATRSAVQDALETAFGYHILQLGVSGGTALVKGSPINHRLYCASRPGEGVGLVAEPDALPLESDSVDAIVAHHCMEFADNPHQVLREIQRVLTPQGQLLIVGFNPYSLMGCKTRFHRLLRKSLWSQHRPVSEHRMTDWLHLLGCEVLDTQRLFTFPPFGSGRLRQFVTRCDQWTTQYNLLFGGIYILHATKQVAGLHPPRRLRLARPKSLIGLVPKPAPAPTPTPYTGDRVGQATRDQGS